VAATFDLDDDLSIEESPWRGRFVSFVVLLLIVAFSAAAAYWFFFRGSETVARATEDIPVERKTINAMLLISGTADAQLNSDLVFQSSGKVALVNVKIGDIVKQGQVLASLDADTLANNVASAQANLRSASLKLEDLRDGSTDADIAQAFQAVEQARAGLAKAQNDYQELQEGASAADLSAAQQAVDGARAQLATAQANQQKLSDSPSDADIAAAEAAVAGAESALTAAENTRGNADNTVTSAAASTKSAEASYCAIPDVTPAFCTVPTAPISAGDATYMQSQLGTTHASLAAAVIAANGTYLNALNGLDSANAAVNSAEDALASARAKLDALNDGPSSEDEAAADAAVASAEAALRTAEDRLADVREGATPEDLAVAQAAVDSADAALAAAGARYDQALEGPRANAIAQAEQAVRSAQLTVDAAQLRLKDSQIIAPFDGTVAEVNITPGEFFGPANADPAIILLTPDRMQVLMDISETDYSNISIGQAGGVIFDGIPGQVYPFVIQEIGLAPSSNQGVVTYKVKATLIVGADAPRPSPGMNARGQIITESRKDVLTVPPRAIRSKGTETVVDVRRNGVIQEVVITTGLSDQNSTEVLTGLQDGDIVVAPVLNTAAQDEQDAPEQLPGRIS